MNATRGSSTTETVFSVFYATSRTRRDEAAASSDFYDVPPDAPLHKVLDAYDSAYSAYVLAVHGEAGIPGGRDIVQLGQVVLALRARKVELEQSMSATADASRAGHSPTVNKIGRAKPNSKKTTAKSAVIAQV